MTGVPFWIGTSGWQYRDWRGAFYPARLPTAGWLEAYAALFPMVEVNSTFYRLPPRSTFEHWAERTAAAELRFVIKASRYLTHVRRLDNPDEPVDRLLDRAEPLGTRLAAVLVQLPPTLRATPDRLAATLAAFHARHARVAFEPRHPSWFTDEVRSILAEYDAALCWTDRRNRTGPLWRSASWTYVRLHEGRTPSSSYGDRALRSWAERLVELSPDDGADAFVAFNNDHLASAPKNALELAGLLSDMGRAVGAPGCPIRAY